MRLGLRGGCSPLVLRLRPRPRLREEHPRLRQEHPRLREEHTRLREEHTRLREEHALPLVWPNALLLMIGSLTGSSAVLTRNFCEPALGVAVRIW